MKDFKLIRKSIFTMGILTASQIISFTSFAEEAPYLDGVGAINLKFMGKCASDLFYNNKVLLPTEACDLAIHGPEALKNDSNKISKPVASEKPATYKETPPAKFDISYLEPDPSTTVIDSANPSQWLWRPAYDASADIIAYKNVESEKKKNPLYGYYDDLKAMGLKENGETLEYVSRTEVSTGRYAIIVKKKTAQGDKYFEIRMDVRGHNFLMRKTLLRKIGYQVPNMDRLATVAIKFSNTSDMFDLVQRLFQETLVEPSRWITDKNVNLMTLKNLSEEKQVEVDEKTKAIQDSLTLNLIDVIAIDGMNDRTLNLGRGRLTSDIIQGRRALNSLLVPFSLVDVPESLGLFNNSMCDIFNGELYLSYEFEMNPQGDSVAFNPRFEDARWISRKIVDLSRNDWQQIVSSARLPAPVSALLTEKLISRRNCLRENLNLKKEKFLTAEGNLIEKSTEELPAKLDISIPPYLINGKLTAPPRLAKDKNPQTNSDNVSPSGSLLESGEESENEKMERWPGYARHFSGIDGDAPQSKSELMAFAKSQLISNLIRMSVNRFNKELPQSNDAKTEYDRNLDLAVWQFGEFLKSKVAPPIPRKIWSYSKYNVFAYPDRDIIAGAYLGADNQVQIADSLTIGAVLGRNFRGEGMPSNVGFRGSAVLNLTQSWVHLKPLASMKKGLKEPLSNIIVPYFEKKARKPLDFIIKLEDEYNSLTKSLETEKDSDKVTKLQSDLRDWRNKFQTQMKEFDKNFGPGESVMVTKSIGPDISAMLTKGVSDVAAIYASARLQVIDLSRVNIVRRPRSGNSPEKLQIYFDPALYSKFRLALGFEARNIPLVEFSWDTKRGVTYTNFFEFNLDSKMSNGDSPRLQNNDFFTAMKAFSAALRGSPMEFFERQQKQTVIEHHFKDSNIGITAVDFTELLKLRLSNFRYLDQSSTDVIKVKTPDGREANYVRSTEGIRKGNDYLNLIARVVSEILKKENPNLQISIQDNGDSGSSFKGRATAQNSFVEAEVLNGRLNLDNILVATRSTWKGWSKKLSLIKEDFNLINGIFGYQVFDFPQFQDTSEIQFYGFNVQVSIYREALQNLLVRTPKEVTAIFDQYGTAQIESIGEIDKKENWAVYLSNKLSTLKAAIASGKAKKASETLATIMSVMQTKLRFDGFVKLCGGSQNVFIQGQASGYRVGDQRMGNETGLPSLIAPTQGKIGSREPSGPLSTILNTTGIANGELFISWLLSPL